MTTIIRHETAKCVLYQSKYGSTKAYAETLAEQLDAHIFPVEEVTKDDLKGVTQVIFGGAFRSGHVLGSKRFFRLTDGLQARRAVFVTAMTVYDEAVMARLRVRVIPEADSEIPLFYTRGRWNPDEMTFIDRQLLKSILKSLRQRPSDELSLTEETLLGLDQRPRDYVDMQYLEPMVRWSHGSPEIGVGQGVFQDEIHKIMGQKLV